MKEWLLEVDPKRSCCLQTLISSARTFHNSSSSNDGGKQIAHEQRHTKESSHSPSLLVDLRPLLLHADPRYEAFVPLLNLCRKRCNLPEGRLVHALVCHHGFDRTTFLSNCFIEMYGNCGSLDDAKAVFDRIRRRDLFSWHILMKAYGQNGSVKDAHAAFSRMPLRNDVSWNTMISAFARNGHGREALDLLCRMHLDGINPSRITFVSLLDVCASLKDSKEGMEIFSLMTISGVATDMVVGTALINMFGKCGAVTEARTVFQRMADRDVITWTAMLATFSQNGYGKDALSCFVQMQEKGSQPDTASFACAIDACASSGELKKGQTIHLSIIDLGYEDQLQVGNALINMYGKCKILYDAMSMFYDMFDRDVVSWTAIIVACTQNGNGKEALEFYNQMRFEGILPNKVTLLCVLDACSILMAIGSTLEIHSTISIVDPGYDEETIMMGNALINVYGKCGSLVDARRVFDIMPKKDVVCWTSMIATLAQSGHVEEALGLFKQMAWKGIKPNDATFVCVLNACSHSGHINAAMEFFLSMKGDHGMEYKMEHYVCMIDLLGRAGHLDKAEDLIARIPAGKASVAWLCLLGACRIHGDAERATHAASHCDELDPNDITPFLTLSNVLSGAMLKGGSRREILPMYVNHQPSLK